MCSANAVMDDRGIGSFDSSMSAKAQSTHSTLEEDPDYSLDSHCYRGQMTPKKDFSATSTHRAIDLTNKARYLPPEIWKMILDVIGNWSAGEDVTYAWNTVRCVCHAFKNEVEAVFKERYVKDIEFGIDGGM